MNRIVDAVTAVLVHDGELLIAQRHPQMPAFPGYHAFPGGKVDKTESEQPFEVPALSAHPARLMRALVREIQEELGIDLEQLARDGGVRSIVELGIALTPPPAPLRFNTHFYRIDLTARPALHIDTREAISSEWATPAALLQRYEQGELLLAPPTVATLRDLASNPAAMQVPELHWENRPFSELPVLEPLRGVRQILVRSHTLPPAEHTNAFLLGDQQSHRVLVDPSPATPEEFEKLKALCQRLVIHEVFLTHHHPDHRQYADQLARHFNAPLGLSQDTYDRIKAKSGMEFFRDLTINVYQEGDVLCRWLGQPVRIVEVPGHDEGQLALMPDNRAWCLVGDLIQGIGTVVIAKPEGNMRKYFDTLRKVIALNPRVIFPSHGIGLGSVFRLEETLRHRELREQQVRALLSEGKTPDEMLPLVYKDLDPRLLPLARLNIESHLDKLREDTATTS